MKPKIVLISGKQGSGKTTLCEGLKERLVDSFIVTEMKFAAPLYRMHDKIRAEIPEEFDLPKDKVDGPLLQDIGEWGRRTRHQDIWARIARNDMMRRWTMNNAATEIWMPQLFIFDDCRFENEITVFDDLKPLKIRLNAPAEVRQPRAKKWREKRDGVDHPSETGLDHYKDWDVVMNTGECSKEVTLGFCATAIIERLL